MDEQEIVGRKKLSALMNSEELRSTQGEGNSRALDYVLGLLSEAEEAEFERTLVVGSEEYEEVQTLMEGISNMASKLSEEAPSPRKSVKSKILAAIAEEEEHANAHKSNAGTDPWIVRGGNEGWQESGLPGITMKVLAHDEATKRYTVLARLVAGARYPEHRHVGNEECYVVEGDLQVNGASLVGGDYILTTDSTIHTDTRTINGCTLLLSTLLQDEMLA